MPAERRVGARVDAEQQAALAERAVERLAVHAGLHAAVEVLVADREDRVHPREVEREPAARSRARGPRASCRCRTRSPACGARGRARMTAETSRGALRPGDARRAAAPRRRTRRGRAGRGRRAPARSAARGAREGSRRVRWSSGIGVSGRAQGRAGAPESLTGAARGERSTGAPAPDDPLTPDHVADLPPSAAGAARHRFAAVDPDG